MLISGPGEEFDRWHGRTYWRLFPTAELQSSGSGVKGHGQIILSFFVCDNSEFLFLHFLHLFLVSFVSMNNVHDPLDRLSTFLAHDTSDRSPYAHRKRDVLHQYQQIKPVQVDSL